MVLAFISLAGWWDACKIAGEVRDPERTVPRALVLGVVIVTAIYIAVTAVFIYLVPPVHIESDEGFAALAGDALFGRSGEIAFAAIVVNSVAGSLAAVLMAAPRVYYAMARDGLFLPGLSKIDPRFHTPARATATQAALAAGLAATGSFEQILSYFMVPTLLFLALTVAAVFVLHHRGAPQDRLTTPGYPASPLLFLVPIIAVMILRVLRDPLRSSIGLFVVALGVPASGWVLSKSKDRDRNESTQRPDETTDSPTPATPISAGSELS
jgi:APA family basic amino acid/polyamine antiporter